MDSLSFKFILMVFELVWGEGKIISMGRLF